MNIGWRDANIMISGYGQTAMTLESGVSEYQLALDAVQQAMAAAGIDAGDVDGLVTFDMDTTEPNYLAHGLGMQRIAYAAKSAFGGGGSCAAFVLAANAVAAGNAECVVVYRAINGRSTTRYGQPAAPSAVREYYPFTVDSGLITPGHRFALGIHRTLADLGLSNLDLAPLCVQQRKYAATNPRAVFHQKPITTEDHQRSPWITEPVLRRLDCCLETDGGAAFVVTTRALAQKAKLEPVRISAAAMGLVAAVELPGVEFFNRSAGVLPETQIVAEELWRLSGLAPSDMDAALLYDHFSPFVLLQLEALGFCSRGQSADFIRSGGIGIDGDLPVNMNGGQLGEGYIHGMNAIAEAVRQLRGDATNQVSQPQHIAVTGGPGIPTSGLILSTA